MATIDQLRSLFPGALSDEDVVMQASKRYGLDPLEIADEVGVKPGGKWGNRFSSSVDNYQAGLYGVGEALGSDWAGKRRESNENAAAFSDAVVRQRGGISSYKDVGGFGDAADYVGGLAVQSLPYLAEAAAGGLVTRGLSTGLRAAARAGDAGAAAALSTRAAIGGAAASYPSAVGDILGNQRDQNGQTDLLSAAAGGVPYAALNYFSPAERLVTQGGIKRIIGAADNVSGAPGVAARLGLNVAGAGVLEGANEMGQEFINQRFGRMAVDPNESFFNPEAIDRYGESFVGGAALGGALGGVAGGWRRSAGYQPSADRSPATAAESNQTTDLLQSYGQDEGPAYENPFARLERVNAEKTGQATWGYEPGATGDLFAPSYPHGYQATRSEDGTNRNIMSGVHGLDLNGNYVELTGDELANNRTPIREGVSGYAEYPDVAPFSNTDIQGLRDAQRTGVGGGMQIPLFDPAEYAGRPEVPPQYSLATNPDPLQQRIDQNLGIGGQRYAQSGYQSQFEAAASEPTGAVVAGAEQGQIERPVTAIEDVQRRAGILAEEDRLKREAQAKYEQKVKAAQTAVFTQAELERGAGKQMAPNVLQAVTALNESPADAAVKQQVIGQLRSALTSNDKQSINAAVKAINSAAKAAVKDAQKLAQAQAAMAQTTPNAPPQAPNAKVVLPKTAPANKAAAPAGQAPANTTAPAGVSGATGQAASVVSQPAPAANVAATGNAVAPGVFDPAKGAQEVTGDDGITRKFNAEGFDLESGKNWLAFASKDQKKAAAGQAIGAYYEATQGTGNPNVPVTTKKTRRVVGMTAAQAAKPGEAVKVSEVPVAEKTEKDKAREKLNDAAERMKAFFTKPTDPFSGTKDLNAGPAIPTELREILVDLAKAAIELGYHSVKESVAHMRRSIIDMVGKDASDRIDDKHLIAARQEAGKYSPKGKAVYGGRVDLAMLHVAMEGRPDLEKAVRYYLLVDDDGTHLPADEVPTLTAAAQKAELGNSDHAQLSRINKLLGLTDSVIRRMRLDHYDETPFGEYGQEIEPENEIEAETNQLGVQQGFREGALSATDDDVEDYDGGELDGVDDETKAAVEARLMGVTPKASKSSVGHSTVDGLVQKTFGTPTNKWFKPFFVPGSDKLKPLAEVSDGDLGAALTALYSYVTTRTLQPRASKAMKEAAAKNQSLLNDLLNELERRQTAGAFDNKKLTRTLEARGEMVKAKAETAAQQAERERKKAQAEKDKEDRNAQQRDEYGREADPVDRREGDERLVPDLTGLDELPEAGTGGLADGEGDGVAEETQSDLGAAPISVTLRLNGETMKFKNAELSMELIRNKVDALTELLNCLRG